MKNKINTNHSFSIFDILEIFLKNIVKIILIVISIFLVLFFLDNSFNAKKETYTGVITIFPINNTYLLNKINRYSELRDEKRREFITQKVIQKKLKDQNVIDKDSLVINNDYFTPTRLVWDFTDLLQKKFLENSNISNVTIESKSHKYFENHLTYLTIKFKFNEFNEDKLDQVNKLLDETILENTNKMRDFTENLFKEIMVLLDLKNKQNLKKLSNLKTILENEKYQEKTNRNILNETIVIVNDGETKFELNFTNIEQYCLNKESVHILSTCLEIVNKKQKSNLDYIFTDINKINEILSNDKSISVKFLSENERVKVSKHFDKLFNYISLLAISIFISLFFVTTTELYKQTRKKN